MSSRFSLGGGRIPAIVAVLIAATFVLSVVGAIGLRHGFPIAGWAALIPDRVVHGQLWRLFTWIFFEVQQPFSLLFACLTLYWFGSDLALRWGPARFLVNYLGLATLIGAVVVGLSLPYRDIADFPYLSPWAVQSGLIILWAGYFPSRQIRVYFILPLGGRNLILATVGVTIVFSIFFGIEAFIPEFVAEAIALAVIYAPSPREWWLERKLRGLEKRRRSSHLRAVPREPERMHDDDKSEPPGGRWLN